MKKKILFFILFSLISFLKSDDLENSKEYEKVKSIYLDICKHFTYKNTVENPHLFKSRFYSCAGNSLEMLLCFDKVFFYRSIDFEQQIRLGKITVNSLKKFENYTDKDFFSEIHQILFNKIPDLENYKIVSKNHIDVNNWDCVSGDKYAYKYMHKNKEVKPDIKFYMKISDENQLLKFNWYGIPKFKERKIIVDKNKAIELLRNEFKKQLAKYSEYYDFNKNTFQEKFNNLVYAVPSKDYLKEGCELSIAYSIENTNYETLQAELSYEMEFSVKGHFVSGGPNQAIYDDYTPKIITDWYFFSTSSNYEYTYTFRLWLDPETGEYKGMSFKSNSSPYDKDIKKDFWENWFDE